MWYLGDLESARPTEREKTDALIRAGVAAKDLHQRPRVLSRLVAVVALHERDHIGCEKKPISHNSSNRSETDARDQFLLSFSRPS